MILTPFANFNYSSITKVKTAFTEYNSLIEQSSLKQASYATAVGSTNKSLGAYLSQLGASKASMSGYLGYLVSTKAATIGTTIATKTLAITIGVLKAAANMAIVTLASWAIEKAIEGIQNLANADQNAIDKANQLNSTYQSNVSTINSNITNLQGLQTQFETLSKGVDDNGKNVGLSTEQYKQYHDIVKQVADIEPSLVQGYDSEGNAIVNRNTALQDAITYEKQELEIEKEKQTYQNGPDVYSGAQSNLKQYTNQLTDSYGSKLESIIEKITKLNKYASGSFQNMLNTNNGEANYNQLLTQYNQRVAEFKTLGLDYNKIVSGNVDELQKAATEQDTIIAKLQSQNNLTDTQKTELTGVLGNISAIGSNVKTAYSSFTNLANIYASLNSNNAWFDKINQAGALSAFDKQVEQIVKNNPTMTMDQFYTSVSKVGQEFAKIQNQIPTEQISKLKTQLSSGKITTDQYNSAIKGIADNLDALGKKYPAISVLIKNLADGIRNFASNSSDADTKTDTTLSDLVDKYKTINTSLTTLQSVQDEYNQTGYLSVDMLEKLAANNGELLKYVDVTNGKLTINSQALQDNANNIKDQMTATVQASLATQIMGIMQDDLSDKTTGAGNATTTAEGQISSMNDTMQNAAIGAEALAGGYEAVQNAFKGIPGSNTNLSAEAKSKVEDAISSARKEIDVINSLSVGTGKNTETQKVNTAAKKAATSAAEQYKNALEKQKDALDQEKKALQSTYDQMQTDQENIKSLLSLVEEMLKQQYFDQKDAYSKLSQQAEDLADKEKTALETQLSALKDKIDLQKKVLDQQKEERSHAEDLADKEKDIATLRTKLAIQQQDTSDASKAKQIQYQKQIADKTKELNDFQYDYSVTTQQNALDALQDKYDKEYKAKEDELDKETTAQKNYYQGLIDQIDQYTAKEVNIRTEAMNLINGRSQDLLNRLLEYNRIYGETMKCPSPLVQ